MTEKIKEYQAWVLCEDKNHYYFIRSFLSALGMNSRKINPAAPIPEGNGSAEQFVREKFPTALRQYARHREHKFLAVVLDVDKDRPPEKMREVLDKVSGDSDMEGIQDADKLLLVFPKKNIETWFEWLCQDDSGKSDVNETQDYKMKHIDKKPTPFGKLTAKLYMQLQSSSGDCDSMLPSMRYAYDSLKKLDELLAKIG